LWSGWSRQARCRSLREEYLRDRCGIDRALVLDLRESLVLLVESRDRFVDATRVVRTARTHTERSDQHGASHAVIVAVFLPPPIRWA